MGGHTVILCLSVLVFYILSANCYVVVVNLPERDNSMETVEIEGKSPVIVIENGYNWYSVATSDEADNICGTTDKEYKYFEGTQSCYKVHTEPATWADAEDACSREGGHLAVINDANEAQIVAGMFPNGFRVVHVGFRWIEDFQTWVTTNGQTLPEAGYANWSVGEPNNITGKQYCGSMYPNRSFDDIDCSDETAFICEKKTFQYRQDTTTEAETFVTTTNKVKHDALEEQEVGTDSFSVEDLFEPLVEDHHDCGTTDPEYSFFDGTQSCYKVHTEGATWSDAEATCRREGGHLAVINSQAEADFLTKHFPPNSYQVFLGFHRTRFWDNPESWITIQGQTLDDAGYETWKYGEPNNLNGDQGCGSMYPDGRFGDIECYVQLAFICERNSNFEYHPDTTTEVQNEDNPSDSDYEESEKLAEEKNRETFKCGITHSGNVATDFTYLESTGSCYKYHTERATWSDAEATCVREGGHLAVINSQDEADFFKGHMTYNSIALWLGFSGKSGSWITVHDETLAEAGYEKWFEGKPGNPTELLNCGIMLFDGTFKNMPCSYYEQYFCEKDCISQLHLAPATEAQTNFDTSETDGKSYQEETLDSKIRSDTTPVETLNQCGTTDMEYKFLESTKSCYKVHSETATWPDAEARCIYEGGHLAVINSQDEKNFLVKNFPPHSYRSRVFLGFQRTGDTWITIQGQTLADTGYENWDEDEPNNFSGDQNCGSMYPDGRLDDIECYEKQAFICERNSNIEYHPDTTTEVQNKFDTLYPDYYYEYDENEKSSATEAFIKAVNKCGTTDTEYTFYESTQSCYKVHKEGATWNDAEAMCRREGGHLVVINSQDEVDIIRQLHDTLPGLTHIFIGFSYRESDAPIISDMYEIRRNGDWLTIDGQTLSEAGYENWTPGEPNNFGGREYCGTIYSNGKFDDSACYRQFAYICEKVYNNN